MQASHELGQQCDDESVNTAIEKIVENIMFDKSTQQNIESRIMPLECYDVQFVDQNQLPIIKGSALSQRVWVLIGVAKVDSIRKNLKLLKKHLENVMNYSVLYDPFYKVRTSCVKLFFNNGLIHIVIDTVSNRKMRTEILAKIFSCLDMRVNYIVMSLHDETQIYAPNKATEDHFIFANDIIMKTMAERKQYRIPTIQYKEFQMCEKDIILNVAAHGQPMYSKIK